MQFHVYCFGSISIAHLTLILSDKTPSSKSIPCFHPRSKMSFDQQLQNMLKL